jgi:tRNA threonylcarbamoyl adenosine modification protein YeaZ
VSLAVAERGFVLALEGSTHRATCAVRAPDGQVTELAAPEGARPVERLPSLAGEVAAEAGAPLARLALVVVGSGPGSYMGIRATVAVANALSYVAKCPVAEISTLDSLGLELATAGRDAVAALAAGRGRYFVASYRMVDGVVERTTEIALVEGSEIPDLQERSPSARGHLDAIDRRPEWLTLQDVAGAEPRYGPSGREP